MQVVRAAFDRDVEAAVGDLELPEFDLVVGVEGQAMPTEVLAVLAHLDHAATHVELLLQFVHHRDDDLATLGAEVADLELLADAVDVAHGCLSAASVRGQA